MPISLKQYAGSLITPTDDALLYDFILSEQTGILEGCTVTHLGANQLQVSAGRGIIRGRVFVIEQETVLANVSTSGTINGRLIVRVDLENTEAPISFTTQTATALPALVQEDINRDGSIYELPLVTYQVTEILISNLKNVAPTLTSPIDDTLRQEVKDLQAGKFNATATRSGSVVSITGPEGAQIITFLTPSAFASGDTYKYNGKAITLTDLNNEALEDAWAAGAPITLSISGSHAFFRAGGGVISDLPPLLPNMRVTVTKGSPKDTYAVKFDKLPDNAETDMLEKFFLTYSYSETPPEKPTASNTLSEKSKSEVLSSAVPPGTLSYIWTVPNDKTIIFRQFTQNAKKQLQTELKGAVWPPVVDPWQLPKFTGNHTIFGDEQSGRIELYESGTLTLSPGIYDFFAVGGGGAGTDGYYTDISGCGCGGGSGYTNTKLNYKVEGTSSVNLDVTVGAGGIAENEAGSSSGIAYLSKIMIEAKGGKGGVRNPNSLPTAGGDGGSGGSTREEVGGSDGSDGKEGRYGSGGRIVGKGQGTTTRAFGSTLQTLYAGGGSSGGDAGSASTIDNSSPGGGGSGGFGTTNAKPGATNTGSGGGGGRGYTRGTLHGAGGSGLVIIRWNNT